MRYTVLYIAFIIFLMRFPVIQASDIRIGLFYDQEIQTAVFSVVQGEYILVAEGMRVKSLTRGSIIHIDFTRGSITVQEAADVFGPFSNIAFRGISSDNIFLIKPVYPSLDAKESDDDLLVNAFGQSLQIINQLNLEKYIAGILEAEAGPDASFEYYKAQAVLARTYAIKNYNRHAFEGFNLCDEPHCQAFDGKSRWNEEIYQAVLETKNEILVVADGQPANIAYHANCGGITSSAALAWNEDLPYMVSAKDPFCSESSHYEWSKVIDLNDWKQYLLKRGIVTDVLPDNRTAQPSRLKYFDFSDRRILLSDIRQDLELKSAFFTVSQQGNNIILNGRGYGHGVGLCQEGAMEMARVGFVYVDILMFYFRDLLLAQYISERED